MARKTELVPITMPKDIVEMARRRADKEMRNFSNFVSKAVKQYLEGVGGNG
jgi:hypothetical protein